MYIIVRCDTKGKMHEVHVRSLGAMRRWIGDLCDLAIWNKRSFKLQQSDLGVVTVLQVAFTDGEVIHVNRSH